MTERTRDEADEIAVHIACGSLAEECLAEGEESCGRPCPENSACDDCERYWQRMRSEGYRGADGRWTDRGMREIRRHA